MQPPSVELLVPDRAARTAANVIPTFFMAANSLAQSESEKFLFATPRLRNVPCRCGTVMAAMLSVDLFECRARVPVPVVCVVCARGGVGRAAPPRFTPAAREE